MRRRSRNSATLLVLMASMRRWRKSVAGKYSALSAPWRSCQRSTRPRPRCDLPVPLTPWIAKTASGSWDGSRGVVGWGVGIRREIALARSRFSGPATKVGMTVVGADFAPAAGALPNARPGSGSSIRQSTTSAPSASRWCLSAGAGRLAAVFEAAQIGQRTTQRAGRIRRIRGPKNRRDRWIGRPRYAKRKFYPNWHASGSHRGVFSAEFFAP